jgi:hypothetical protein
MADCGGESEEGKGGPGIRGLRGCCNAGVVVGMNGTGGVKPPRDGGVKPNGGKPKDGIVGTSGSPIPPVGGDSNPGILPGSCNIDRLLL